MIIINTNIWSIFTLFLASSYVVWFYISIYGLSVIS